VECEECDWQNRGAACYLISSEHVVEVVEEKQR
jgi:hypothetical protein